MSHYEERLQEDLDRLHTTVQTLGDTVGTAMRNAVRALLENDVELANEVIIGDLAINRSSRDLTVAAMPLLHGIYRVQGIFDTCPR